MNVLQEEHVPLLRNEAELLIQAMEFWKENIIDKGLKEGLEMLNQLIEDTDPKKANYELIDKFEFNVENWAYKQIIACQILTKLHKAT